MRPRLLDLFCGAGGAAVGYSRAGFNVVGVDINPQPRFPFEFIQADAMTFDLDGFDAIHASPPCQMYSKALRHLSDPQPALLFDVERRLRAAAVPWVIENVEGAPIPRGPDIFGNWGIMLCGTSFGLRVYRHRLFLSSFPLRAPDCNHGTMHAMNPHNAAGRERMYAEFGRGDPELLWAKEMGVEWMRRAEVREAIPPAYTEWIGKQLLHYLRREAA